MELLYVQEHLNCFHYDHSVSPAIEVCRYNKQEGKEWEVNTNEIIFLMKGKGRFSFTGLPLYEAKEGEFVFLPSGGSCMFTAQESSQIAIFRVQEQIKLCENYLIEKLYGVSDPMNAGNPSINGTKDVNGMKSLYVLKINELLQHFLDGLAVCVEGGIRCRHYFTMKIREFFLILRYYYPKEHLREFLCYILSSDTAFSEYVRKNWQKYRTVQEFSESLHMTPTQFSRKFQLVFRSHAYKWMKEKKATAIHVEISTGRKPFKMIAVENGFNTMSQFTKFCKTELGSTPSEIRRG